MRRFQYIGGGSEKSWEIDSPGASVTSADTDEDTWNVPPSWWRQADPFRGRGPAPTVVPDSAATRVVADLRAGATRLDRVLDHPESDAELVELARLHLQAAGGGPLGAAAAGAVLAATGDWQFHDHFPAIVDQWVVGHGVVFAAEAGALLGSVRVLNPRRPHVRQSNGPMAVLPAAPDDQGSLWRPLLRRLRTLLAAASDADYAEATARLAELRTGRLGVHLATSYLLPTEQDWVDQDIATIRSTPAAGTLWLLIPSVTTERQATAIIDAAGVRHLSHDGELYNVAAQVGPDVAPVLARVFDADVDAEEKRRVAAMLGEIPTDTAFRLLLDRLGQKYVAPAVLEAIARFPRRAMRLLAEAATGSGPPATTARALLRDHAISNPAIAEQVRPQLTGPAAQALDTAQQSGPRSPEAPADQIPPVLVTPPWTNRRSRPKPVVVSGIANQSPVTLRWKPGEREAWAQADTGYTWMLGQIGEWAPAVRRAAAGRDWRQVAIFALGPEELVRPHLSSAEPSHNYEVGPALRRVLGRFGDDAVAYVLLVVLSTPTSLAGVLLPFEGSEIAVRMADWYVRSKSIRPVAMSWFDRHAAAAARDLVPPALGPPGKDRANAEAALRLLDQRGHREAIRAAAADLGPAAAEGIDATLALDPLELLPARIPALPAWLDPAQLPQVLLPDRRRALPAAAVGHLCTMLAMSRPGDTYAGVEMVRAAVDPLSAAEMAWGLFERWQSAGYPAKDGWVLDALALLGDAETVRRLAPLIRAWPGEAAHKRAVTGLDVLSAIGTDVALMHLHGVAEKAKFAGLKAAAKAKMDEVAESLGLSAEQLADRLVPDFGLDAHGSMVLDYGERRFHVGFDEQLKPVVADEDGSRRKLLPKPGSKDDPALAPAAYARFAGLKKDVKTVAANQIRRFERAMVAGRRWTAGEQRTLFVDHPLLRHLAGRLVWATFDAKDRATGSFRVAEDLTLADSTDDELTLAGDTVVGIAHPLHLGETLEAWSDVFADYEILQPFPQLGREVFALNPDERSARLLNRFAGVTVYTGKILGLSHRGWQRGSPQDAGVTGVVYKPVRDGRAIVVDLDPGIIAGDAMEWPEQTITGVWVNDGPADWGNGKGNLAFDVLDDITASEMLRDLEGLRS